MEKKKARNWYWWLWLSPLLTIPTLLLLFLLLYFSDLEAGGLIAVLGSALWHLVLLIPALNKRSEFVRWHGRQALLLAGVMTAVLLVFAFLFVFVFDYDFEASPLIPGLILIAVWFFGTRWGQRQAARGDCSLMRWSGQQELLSALQRAEEEARKEEEVAEEADAEALVEIIRFSRDREARREALSKLERLRMVERL